MHFHSTLLIALFACTASSQVVAQAPTIPDPLPSWNEGQAKTAIVTFVKKVTDEQSADFIPQAERIVAFDNDGTLWSEQPMYFQLAFAMDRVKRLAPTHPQWNDQQPFRSVLEGDFNELMTGGLPSITKLIGATHAGMTSEEFNAIVTGWIETAEHPTTGRLYKEMIFQPMLEVLDYLRKSGFKTFIVSGGGIDFMRPWVEATYGIPPEQVVGSSIKTEFQLRDGQPVIIRLSAANFVNDREGKPVGINRFIGRRPIAAFGNSDGDLQMLQWTTVGQPVSLGVIIHHTDANREWAYDRKSPFGKLDQGLNQAFENGWIVVDMAKDWNQIYPKRSK